MITPEIETELFAYIGGIAANNNSKLVAANGTANHVHLLILLSKTIGVSELVGDIKRNSSRWIKTKDENFKTFGWQDGFAAFSVGQTQVPMVKEYIADQKEKHGKQKFEDEMRMFYDKYGIEYDERYVWDYSHCYQICPLQGQTNFDIRSSGLHPTLSDKSLSAINRKSAICSARSKAKARRAAFTSHGTNRPNR